MSAKKKVLDLRFATVGSEWDNHLSRRYHHNTVVADGEEISISFIWENTEYGRQQTLWSLSSLLKGVKTLEISSEGCDSYGENNYCDKIVIDYKKSYDFTISNIVLENKLRSIATDFFSKKGIDNPYELLLNKNLEVVVYATSKPDYFCGQETNYLAIDEVVELSDRGQFNCFIKYEVKYHKDGGTTVYIYGITR